MTRVAGGSPAVAGLFETTGYHTQIHNPQGLSQAGPLRQSRNEI